MAAAPPRDDPPVDEREFIEFRAETRAWLQQFKDRLNLLAPLYEQRSGDRKEMEALHNDVGELKKDVAEVRSEVKKMAAIIVGVNIAAVIIMWLVNSGILRWGAP